VRRKIWKRLSSAVDQPATSEDERKCRHTERRAHEHCRRPAWRPAQPTKQNGGRQDRAEQRPGEEPGGDEGHEDGGAHRTAEFAPGAESEHDARGRSTGHDGIHHEERNDRAKP
jgi:hypothetical protein